MNPRLSAAQVLTTVTMSDSQPPSNSDKPESKQQNKSTNRKQNEQSRKGSNNASAILPGTKNESTLKTEQTTITMESGRKRLPGSNSWLLVMERNQALRKYGKDYPQHKHKSRIHQGAILPIPPSHAAAPDEAMNHESVSADQSLVKSSTNELNQTLLGGSQVKSKAQLAKSLKTDGSDSDESENGQHSQLKTHFKSKATQHEVDGTIPAVSRNAPTLPGPPRLLQALDPYSPGPVCAICHHSDVGYLITPCNCPHSKPVHFHCIKQKILKSQNKSLTCPLCGEPMRGMEPIFDHIHPRRIRLASFRFFLVLFAALIIKYLFFVAHDYKGYFRSFFCFFFGICLCSIAMYLILQLYCSYYNRKNRILVDVILEPDTVCVLI